MGFFDLPTPAFDALDGLLVGLPAGFRLLLWAALTSAVTMKLYQWTSRQERMAALKAEAREAQRALAGFDGEFEEMMPLVKRSIGAATKQLGLALGPALLASLPVVFLLTWAATRFAYEMPAAGAPVAVTVEANGTPDLRWMPADAVTAGDRPQHFVLRWPPAGDTVALQAGGDPLLTLPAQELSPIIHHRAWWNVLFANPAGYLPAEAPVEAIRLELPHRSYLPFGPPWLRGWLALTLSAIFAFSLLFKVWWRIH